MRSFRSHLLLPLLLLAPLSSPISCPGTETQPEFGFLGQCKAKNHKIINRVSLLIFYGSTSFGGASRLATASFAKVQL